MPLGNAQRFKMNRVLLRGPILTQSGYGEHARFVWRALKDDPQFEVFIEPTIWGSTCWLWEDDDERRAIDEVNCQVRSI